MTRIVLLQEPLAATARRLGYRILIASGMVLLAVFAPWAMVSTFGRVGAGWFGLLAAFGVINLIKNRRVLLELTESGSIVWPRSVQEILLRREGDWVTGADVIVTDPPAGLPVKSDPRITLAAGGRQIRNVPLYGMEPDDFVAAANEVIGDRGIRLTYLERETDPPEPTDQLPE